MSDSDSRLAGVGSMVTLPVADLLHTRIQLHTYVWIWGGEGGDWGLAIAKSLAKKKVVNTS